MTTRKNIYPFLILFLLGSFLCFSVWSAKRAIDSGPEVTDADYYSKGLRYSSTVLEKKAASVLGWKLSTDLVGRTVEFHLSDKGNHPVRSARGVISLYLSDSTSVIKLPLQETTPGTYIFKLTDSMTGVISARIEFEYDGARLNRQLLLNL